MTISLSQTETEDEAYTSSFGTSPSIYECKGCEYDDDNDDADDDDCHDDDDDVDDEDHK